MTVTMFIVCLVAIGVAAFIGPRVARKLSGDYRLWAAAAGTLLSAAYVAAACNPKNPIVALIIGVFFVFCAAVAIWREPVRKAV